MKKKDNGNNKKFDRERETRVLLEKIDSDVRAIAEGQSANDARLIRVENTLSELVNLKSDVQTIKMVVMDTNQKVKSIDQKLDTHETRITKLEEKVHT